MSTVQTDKVPSSLLDAVNSSKKAGRSDNEISQDRFMTLLVTQMRNQDPLNPLDNAQVTSQLAQLSTVTGIDKLNTTLESLKTSFQANQSLQAASMIGRAVLVPGADINLQEGQALLGVELTEPVDKLQLNIRDSAGRVVRTMDLDAREPGVYPLGWDGLTDDGSTAPDGRYSFDLKATRGESSVTAKSLAFGEVGSVSTSAQGVKLNLSNIGPVDFNEVRQIL